MRPSQALRLGRFAFIRCMNHPYLWLPAASGAGGQPALENKGCWGAGLGEAGGRRHGSLLAWFSSAQVFAILNKCAVSDLSSFSAETYNDAEQGNKTGPPWALVVMLDGPKFRPHSKKNTIAWENGAWGCQRQRGVVPCLKYCVLLKIPLHGIWKLTTVGVVVFFTLRGVSMFAGKL